MFNQGLGFKVMITQQNLAFSLSVFVSNKIFLDGSNETICMSNYRLGFKVMTTTQQNLAFSFSLFMSQMKYFLNVSNESICMFNQGLGFKMFLVKYFINASITSNETFFTLNLGFRAFQMRLFHHIHNAAIETVLQVSFRVQGSCSQCVPIKFPKGSTSLQCVPQDVKLPHIINVSKCNNLHVHFHIYISRLLWRGKPPGPQT